MRPAEEQADSSATTSRPGRADVGNQQRIQDLLLGSLAASPQLIAVAFIGSDLKAISPAATSTASLRDRRSAMR